MTKEAFTEMRQMAYAYPLVQARGAAGHYFRQIDAESAIGLTINA